MTRFLGIALLLALGSAAAGQVGQTVGTPFVVGYDQGACRDVRGDYWTASSGVPALRRFDALGNPTGSFPFVLQRVNRLVRDLAYDAVNDRIWILATWHNLTGPWFPPASVLIEFDLPTLTQLRSIDVPGPFIGIAHDSGQLFVSNGQSVQRVDPTNWTWFQVSGGPAAAADGLLFDAVAGVGWQWNTIVTSSGVRGVLREFDPARNAFSGPAAVHGYPGMPATLLPGSLSGGELWRDPLTGARHAVLLIVDTVVTCRLDARTGPECGDRFTLAPVVLGGEIRCEYQTPRSSIALFAAFGPGNISLPLPSGCAVHLDPATLVWLVSGSVPVNGMGSLGIPVVVPPNLLDMPLWFQAVTLGGTGLGATQGHVAAVKVR